MKKKTVIICIIVAIAVFAASLGITYAVITVNRTPAATPDQAATVDSAVSATDTPTEAPTKVPTEAPTEPDDTDAYRAYLKELDANKTNILNYNWQASGSDTKPVVFADIMGDDTPEMIYVYAEKVFSTQNGHNQGMAGMRVFTYHDGGIKQAYQNSEWSQNYVQVSDEPYLLFQTQDDKALYAYRNTSKTYASFAVLRFSDNGDGSLSEETAVSLFYGFSDVDRKAEINGSSASVSEAEQKARAMIESRSSALMNAANGKDRYQDHNLQRMDADPGEKENQAMTYDEAVAYLKELIGEVSTDTPEEPAADYSKLSGYYHASINRGPQSYLTIREDGSFIMITINRTINTKSLTTYSSCRGKITDFTQTDDLIYTFRLSNMTYDTKSGTTGTELIDGQNTAVKYIDPPIEGNSELTLYCRGIRPSSMNEDTKTEYQWALKDYTDDPVDIDILYADSNVIYFSSSTESFKGEK